MDVVDPTLISLGLLGFFALLLVGGLVLVGALGVVSYRSFREKQPEEGSERQGCLAAALLAALLAFLGILGLFAMGVFLLLSTLTGAAGVASNLRDETPEVRVLVPTPAPSAPVAAKRPRVVAEVKGALDADLVQRLSDIATRRRELDLRVRSRQLDSGEVWVYEFVLPPIELDPETLQRQMLEELQGHGLVPVALTTKDE